MAHCLERNAHQRSLSAGAAHQDAGDSPSPSAHHRRPESSRTYDYSSLNAHFIALYTYRQESLFGNLFSGKMLLNASGQTIQDHWLALPERYCGLSLDDFAVTPSRVCGIVLLSGEIEQDGITEIIDEFKACSTQQLSRMHERLDLTLWQRQVCRLAIRNDTALHILRHYMQVTSPLQQILA